MTEPILTPEDANPVPAEVTEDLSQPYAKYRQDRGTEIASDEIDAMIAERKFELAQERQPTAADSTSAAGVVRAGAGAVKSVGSAAIDTVRQVPLQTVGGVRDAVVGTLDAIDDMREFALHGVMSDDAADRIMEKYRSITPAAIARKGLPEVPDPRGMGGTVVREGVKFMSAFVPLVGQVNKFRQAHGLTGAAARIAGDAVAGFMSSFLVMDPLEGALESFVEENPDLRGPIDEFMSRDEEDPAVVNRLKNGVEDFGLGIVADGVLQGLRVIKAGRAAKRIAKEKEIASAAKATIDDRVTQAREALESEKLALSEPLPADATDAQKSAQQGRAEEIDAKIAEAQQRLDLAAGNSLPEGAASIGPLDGPRLVTAETGAKRLADAEKRIEAKFGTDNISREEITALAALEETKIEVNLERIDSPEDVTALFQEVTDIFAESTARARRHVRPNQLTEEAADRLGLTARGVLRRRRGQTLNAEESVAFRKVWDSAATQVVDLATAARAPNAGPVDQFKFRKALVAFEAINEQVLGARAETARALQSWNIKVGGTNEQGRMLNQLLEASGGEKVTALLADRIASAAANGATPGQLGAMMRRGRMARTIEAVQESFVLGLLWTPSTHIVNNLGNSIVLTNNLVERFVAEKVFAQGGGVAPGESMAQFHGLMVGINDLFSLAAQRVRGQSVDAASESLSHRYIREGSKLDMPEPKISSKAFGLAEKSGLGRAVDFAGAATRLPGKALGAEDFLFKSVGYSMELHAQAHRAAFELGGTADEIAANYVKFVNDPPEKIRIAAADMALYSTFQDDVGTIGKVMVALRRGGQMRGGPGDVFIALGRLATTVVLPFVKIPTKLMSYSFERVPALSHLNANFRKNIAAGGAEAEIAKARLAVGATVLAAVSDLTAHGYITGVAPNNAGEREAATRRGVRFESIRVGDTYYPYSRTDPAGFVFSIAANVQQVIDDYDVDEEDAAGAAEIIAAATLATATTSLNKSYFYSMSQLVDAVKDPERYGGVVVERLVSSFVPAHTLLRSATKLTDPTRSDPVGVAEAVQSMIPIWQASLTRRRDLWGKVVTSEQGYSPSLSRIIDVTSPIKASRVKQSPIDEEISAQGMSVQRIRKKTTFQGVDVNMRQFPEVYEKYVELAGHALENAHGMGAEEWLSAVVSGNVSGISEIYNMKTDGPDGTKSLWIRGEVTRFRRSAQNAIAPPRGIESDFQGEQFDQFRDFIRTQQEAKRVAAREALMQ